MRFFNFHSNLNANVRTFVFIWISNCESKNDELTFIRDETFFCDVKKNIQNSKLTSRLNKNSEIYDRFSPERGVNSRTKTCFCTRKRRASIRMYSETRLLSLISQDANSRNSRVITDNRFCIGYHLFCVFAEFPFIIMPYHTTANHQSSYASLSYAMRVLLRSVSYDKTQ